MDNMTSKYPNKSLKNTGRGGIEIIERNRVESSREMKERASSSICAYLLYLYMHSCKL